MEPSVTRNEERVRRMLAKVLTPADTWSKLLQPLRDRPGKFLRSRLFLAALSSAEASEATLKIALGLELLHLASLVHDDLIDGSTLRRGADSLWHSHGGPTALLCGDYLFAEAFLAFCESGISVAPKLMRDLVQGMVKAEVEQHRHAFCWNLPSQHYLRRVRLKTARFFAVAAGLGSIASLRPLSEFRKTYRFGLLLGMAYQLMDDLEDLLEEEDLKQGIFILPLLELARQDKAGEKILKRIASAKHVKTGDSKRLRERLADTNGYLSTVARIKAYLEQAELISLTLPYSLQTALTEYLKTFRASMIAKDIWENRLSAMKKIAEEGIIL